MIPKLLLPSQKRTQLTTEAWARLQFRPLRRPSDWAEAELQIAKSSGSPLPGPLSFDHTPYLREIVDCANTPGVRKVVLKTAARVAKTTAMLCIAAYRISEKPSKIIWGRDSNKTIRKFCKLEWNPMLEVSPAMRALIPKDRKNKFTFELQEFLEAPLIFTGVKSAGAIAGDTVDVVLGDEVDKWGDGGGKETSPVKNIQVRNTTSEQALTVLASTPTTEHGGIAVEFADSDQRHFFMPCPHCAKKIEFVWSAETVIFDHCRNADGSWDLERVLSDTYYRCPECGGKIVDGHKPEMLLRGEWIPTAKGRPGVRGYYLNQLYAPWKDTTFGGIALEYLDHKAQGFWDAMRKFRNSVEGLEWRDDAVPTLESHWDVIEKPYARGTIVGKHVLMTVDVQTYGKKWVVRSWNDNHESWLVDYGLCPDWSTLDRIQQTYGVSAVGVDINYKGDGAKYTQEAKEAIMMRRARGWVAIEGKDELDSLVIRKELDPLIGTGLQGQERIVSLWLSGYDLKTELALRVTGRGPAGWWIHRGDLMSGDPDAKKTLAQYRDEMTGEKLLPRLKKKAGSKHADEWRRVKKDNHAWDCEYMMLGLWSYYFTTLHMRAPASTAAKRKVVGAIG